MRGDRRRFRRYLAEKEKTGEWVGSDGEVPDGVPSPAGGEVPDGEPPSTGGEVPAGVPSAALDDDGRPRKFAYPPQLVVVDGGQPQVAAARRALDELGIDDVAVCGLAKRLEEVWLPGEDDPVVLPRTSEGLYLLQRVRDTAHDFAIRYQRSKRTKRLRTGPLDAVPEAGRGPEEDPDQTLRLGEAAPAGDNRADLRGPRRRPEDRRGRRARALAQAAPAAPAVNTATGEIMEDDNGDTARGRGSGHE